MSTDKMYEGFGGIEGGQKKNGKGDQNQMIREREL